MNTWKWRAFLCTHGKLKKNPLHYVSASQNCSLLVRSVVTISMQSLLKIYIHAYQRGDFSPSSLPACDFSSQRAKCAPPQNLSSWLACSVQKTTVVIGPCSFLHASLFGIFCALFHLFQKWTVVVSCLTLWQWHFFTMWPSRNSCVGKRMPIQELRPAHVHAETWMPTENATLPNLAECCICLPPQDDFNSCIIQSFFHWKLIEQDLAEKRSVTDKTCVENQKQLADKQMVLRIDWRFLIYPHLKRFEGCTSSQIVLGIWVRCRLTPSNPSEEQFITQHNTAGMPHDTWGTDPAQCGVSPTEMSWESTMIFHPIKRQLKLSFALSQRWA